MILTKKDCIKWILLFLLSLSAIAMFFVGCAKSVAVNAQNHQIPTIIIDAGHGGEDGGAVAIDGTMEKNINLSIAKQLCLLCQSAGMTTIMTRNEDVSIHDENCNTVKARKTSDMNNRLKIFNADSNAIVVSIHQNKFEKEKYFGSQVFFSPNNPKSEFLAENIRLSVTGMLQKDNTREKKKADKNIFLLYHCKQPSVLVECGFLSNNEELSKLKSDDYQKQMAFSIYCGILEYITTVQGLHP